MWFNLMNDVVTTSNIIDDVRVVISNNIAVLIRNINGTPCFTQKFRVVGPDLSSAEPEPMVFVHADFAKFIKDNFNERALTSIIYHEIGHIKNGDLDLVPPVHDLEREIQADAYVVKHGYGVNLTMFIVDAFIRLGWAINSSEKDFNKRLDALCAASGLPPMQHFHFR